MSCEYISARKLDYYVNNPNAVIIDLRSAQEYQKGHILNARNIPYNNMEELLNHVRMDFGRKNGGLVIDGQTYERNMVFVLYCGRGSLSLSICSRMAQMGYNVKSVVGGISQYHGPYLT